MATSQHVSAAAINAGGSGYVAGDILTITHAGAWHDCKIEVLTVDGGGAVLTSKILDNGAFANRVATVTPNAGGTGYAVGDIIYLTTGTYREFCKVKVDTLSGSAVATCSIFETGGAYSVAPDATGGATDNAVGNGTGTGCTIDTTMTGLIGTTAIAVTGGTGSSATFDLTLTETGWTANTSRRSNQNNYTYNSITDEKEVWLEGTVTGGDEPICGFRTYTYTSGIDTFHGIAIHMCDTYNSSLTYQSQLNLQPANADPSTTNGLYLIMLEAANDYWIRIDGRHITCVVKNVGSSTTSYNHLHTGLLEPYVTTTEQPYPAYMSAGSARADKAADAADNYMTGPTEMVGVSSSYHPGQVRYPDANWWGVVNTSGTSFTAVNVITPLGIPNQGTSNTNEGLASRTSTVGGFEIYMDKRTISNEALLVATDKLMPALGTNEIQLFPTSCVSSSLGVNDTSSNNAVNNVYTVPRGDVSGIYWCPATDNTGAALVAEDVIDVGGQDYILFQNAHRTERYSYWALKRN